MTSRHPAGLRRGEPRSRRGVAAVLAMLYLVLLCTLAVGFYAATTMSAQVAANERKATSAQQSAETGMQFMRFQLSHVQIPPLTPEAEWLDRVYAVLKERMAGTGNLYKRSVALDSSAPAIHVPAAREPMIDLGDGTGFRAKVARVGRELEVTVTGCGPGGKLTRAVRMRYEPYPIDLGVFNYGVAGKGKFILGGEFDLVGETQAIDGSVFTATLDPLKISVEIRKRASISGDVYMTDPDGVLKVGEEASIHGTTDPLVYNAQYVHRGVTAPEFPKIDTSPFIAYATNTYTGGKTDSDGRLHYTNTVIPPNTNPKFDKETVIEGVLYIQMPNVVTFQHNTVVRGIIVVEKSANPLDYAIKKNAIEFSKTAELYGLAALPSSADFPEHLRYLTDATMLAPDTRVTFKGASKTWAGSLVAEDLTFSGFAAGRVTGSIICFGDVKFDRQASIVFDRSADRRPSLAGLSMTSNFVPLLTTYEEVQP